MVVFLHNFPTLFVGRSPRNVAVIVRRTLMLLVAVRFSGGWITVGPDEHAVGRHLIKSARHQAGGGFAYEKSFARIIFREIGKIFMMIIESVNIERIRLKQVVPR